jgi:hypothetical protein
VELLVNSTKNLSKNLCTNFLEFQKIEVEAVFYNSLYVSGIIKEEKTLSENKSTDQ